MKLKPIGVINSPYKTKEDAPRQGRFSDKISQISIFDEYMEGLEYINLYRHFFVLYWFDKAERDNLKGVPPGKTEERGIFSIRGPNRPNPIGLCMVEVIEIEGNTIKVKWLDALDKSPLLDIKPFWPEIDCI